MTTPPQPSSPPGPASPRGPRSEVFAQDGHGFLHKALRRLRGRQPQRNLMPLLIRVYAGFSKLDGEAHEEEIESSLGFMRYDYPEAVYSELRSLYRKALSEPQDLNAMAAELNGALSHDEKIQLAVQLYVLITRSSLVSSETSAFQNFMEGMNMAQEARAIVGQLAEVSPTEASASSAVLEMLDIGGAPPADLVLPHLSATHSLSVFRFQNLLLLKNTGSAPLIARGRQLATGEFLRLYDGQRVVLGDHVIDHQDLVFYLNARKGVSSTSLFLSLDSSGGPFLERERSRNSILRISFGLSVEVTALRHSDITVSHLHLQPQQKITAALTDRINFPDSTSISFAELRRRAREMGGRFDLHPGRAEYLVSNNPALLRRGDILLSPALRSELLLRIRFDPDEKSGELEVIKAPRPVTVERLQVREKEKTRLHDGAVIALGEGQYLRCRFADGLIEEERNIIRDLEIADVSHSFGRGTPAVDSVSFTVRRGEMICVLGPSGSGKSSLLRILAGHLQPSHGNVRMNGRPLYENLPALCPYISYIPHEDAFDPLLTVQENLECAATMRSPHLQRRDITRRVDAKLIELGLNERRSRPAGTPEQKILSSGERKRLNVGLDMITPADVFLFDEPTSGLSSKDSEHVLEIIRGLAHNKIVFVSIHQPSARLFHLFQKAILLDNGGKLVFFGKPQEMLGYFREAWSEQLAQPAEQAGATLPPPDFHQPEFVFDVLETPLRDLSGDALYEEDARGHMAPARRFSPDFWRDRFQAHLVLEDVRDSSLQRPETNRPAAAPAATGTSPATDRPTFRERRARLAVMMRRAVLSRLRNRGNMVTTLLEAPLLAILIATVLRWSEDGDYTFASAFHVPTYLFMSLVVAMFLGLTNSADEIIRDRVLLQRERNYSKNAAGYILSKMLALGAVSLIQDVIYLSIGNSILEVREMFLPYLLWMFLTSLCGVSIGLLVSSLVRDAKTALNIIPLILIPQIILGGALIKYEEMNRNLDFVYSIRKWLKQGTDASSKDNPSNLRVPFLCEFMPLRWSYEGIVLTQAYHNPLNAAQDALNDRIKALSTTLAATTGPAPEMEKALSMAKDALVKVSGLEARSPADLVRSIQRIMDDTSRGTFDPDAYRFGSETVTAEQIFENQKIRDLISKAEMERTDKRRKSRPNVFFGREKRFIMEGQWLGRSWQPLDFRSSTIPLNAAILAAWILLPLVILFLVLRRQLRRV